MFLIFLICWEYKTRKQCLKYIVRKFFHFYFFCKYQLFQKKTVHKIKIQKWSYIYLLTIFDICVFVLFWLTIHFTISGKTINPVFLCFIYYDNMLTTAVYYKENINNLSPSCNFSNYIQTSSPYSRYCTVKVSEKRGKWYKNFTSKLSLNCLWGYE